ncbi:hypothetical protein, partial [uncultured Rhodoblastus sp.]|uniref:hypothetical protein n=1 Tax=uncultured Rhodoblastus sp. TaxID=543037 RepID=UPI0025DAF698
FLFNRTFFSEKSAPFRDCALGKKAMFARDGRRRRQGLEHIPQKWTPVLRKGYAFSKESGAYPASSEAG